MKGGFSELTRRQERELTVLAFLLSDHVQPSTQEFVLVFATSLHFV